jgi:hypothetical protein
MTEIEKLKNCKFLLKDNANINLPLYSQLLTLLPDWLVQKMQLVPSVQLGNKLSCLAFQLSEFLDGKAQDIEDHFLLIGVSKSDLTYRTGETFMVVDITTSTDPKLLKFKRDELADQCSGLPLVTSYQVVTIAKTHTAELFATPLRSNDLLDSFNRLLVAAPLKDQEELTSLLSTRSLPALVDRTLEMTEELVQAQLSERREGNLVYDLTAHTKNWHGLDSNIVAEMQENLPLASCHSMRSPVVLPISERRLVQVSMATAMSEPDPLVAATALAMLVDVLLPGIIHRFSSTGHSIYEEDPKTCARLFRNHGVGKIALQHIAMADPDKKCLYVMYSGPVVENTSPDKLVNRHYKLMDVACGPGWSGYGRSYLTRGYETTTQTKATFEPITLEMVQECQKLHDDSVELLSSRNQASAISYASKIMSASKVTEGKDLLNLLVAGCADKGTHLLNTLLFKIISDQYELARLISSTLSDKHPKERFRLATVSGSTTLYAISTSTGIAQMWDVAVSCFSSSPMVVPQLPRAKNRTLTLSNRLLAWWVRLPSVYLCRGSQAVQHNASLTPGSKLSDSLSSVVEHTIMHLTTRQQDSLMEDQVRYVLAGLMSPEANRLGPLEKVRGVSISSPSLIVYWARLVKLQAVSFLTKSGMSPKIAMSKECPPVVVPPQHSTVCTTYGLLVDAMFDSKIFNKDKDHKMDSQALDWLGLMKTEVKYQQQLNDGRNVSSGMSEELRSLISSCVKAKSIKPLLSDLYSTDSVWNYSMVDWWKEIAGLSCSVDFGWNAAAFYTIAMSMLKRKKLTTNMDDFTGYLADLLGQSVTSFMSSSGATSKGPPTKDRQAVRKSTAMLTFLGDTLRESGIMAENVGNIFYTESLEYPGRHQSVLSQAVAVMCFNGERQLVTRTETKEQSGGGREFSAANDVGIISTRAEERVFSTYLKTIETDCMTTADTDSLLMSEVDKLAELTKMMLAADNSRFGPMQVMAKSRAYAAVLCTGDSGYLHDVPAASFMYELLAEPTRLFEARYTKMPFDLYEHIHESGGLKSVKAKHPESTLGQLASIMIDKLGYQTLEPGFKHRYGMNQGAMGMFSSGPSSLLHDFFRYCLLTTDLAEKVRSLVTNDDSLILISGTNPELEQRYIATWAKSLLRICLGYGGQILNMFKTVASTIIAEFHSSFALQEGLIIPELKLMIAALQFGSGEKMSDDAGAIPEQGVNLVRSGCSLFTATALCVFLTVVHCDQYNRWSAFQKHGVRPVELGGPVRINLMKELVIPSYGTLSWHADKAGEHNLGKAASRIATSMFSEEEDKLLQLEQAGLVMTTRKIFKDARGNKETAWLKPAFALPLTGVCTIGCLTSSITSGLLRSNTELGADKLLPRFGRNQVSPKYVNIALGKHSWVAADIGSTSLSYNMLDGVSKMDLSKDLPEMSPAVAMLSKNIEQLLYLCHDVGMDTYTFGQLIKSSQQGRKKLTVRPVSVKAGPLRASVTTPETAIRLWGSNNLKAEYIRERAGHYSPNTMAPLLADLKAAMAVSGALSKVGKKRDGSFKVVGEQSYSISIDMLVSSVAQHAIRGLITANEVVPDFMAAAGESLARVYEPEVEPQDEDYKHILAKIKVGSVVSQTQVTVADGDVLSLLSLAPSGWFQYFGGKIKVKRFSSSNTKNGFKAYKVCYLITKRFRGRAYSHVIVCEDREIDMSKWIGVEGQYSFLSTYRGRQGDRRRVTNQDEVYFASRTDFPKLRFERGGNCIFATTGVISWPAQLVPVVVARVPPVFSEHHPTQADAVVYFSLGNQNYHDKQIVLLSDEPADPNTFMSLAGRFNTYSLLSSLKAGMGSEPKVPVYHDLTYWRIAQSKMLSAKITAYDRHDILTGHQALEIDEWVDNMVEEPGFAAEDDEDLVMDHSELTYEQEVEKRNLLFVSAVEQYDKQMLLLQEAQSAQEPINWLDEGAHLIMQMLQEEDQPY